MHSHSAPPVTAHRLRGPSRQSRAQDKPAMRRTNGKPRREHEISATVGRRCTQIRLASYWSLSALPAGGFISCRANCHIGERRKRTADDADKNGQDDLAHPRISASSAVKLVLVPAHFLPSFKRSCSSFSSDLSCRSSSTSFRSSCNSFLSSFRFRSVICGMSGSSSMTLAAWFAAP
jgi:hypothetical protein